MVKVFSVKLTNFHKATVCLGIQVFSSGTLKQCSLIFQVKVRRFATVCVKYHVKLWCNLWSLAKICLAISPSLAVTLATQ
jgi:hypothetical protein